MSLQGALDIASGGLTNINLGLSLISQNIANASTPQYAEEVFAQQSLSAGGQELGVRSGTIVAASDPALQLQVNEAAAQGSAAQTTSNALSQLQPLLGTVGSSDDLGSLLTAVQSAFSTLLNDPSNVTQQAAVVQSATTLTSSINALSQGYGAARQTAQNALVTQVGQLNTALSKIGSYNAQIEALQSEGLNTADLVNQRAQAESTITGLISARFLPQPNGSVIVTMANGSQLPTDTPNPLSISAATTGPTTFYPGGGLPGILLQGQDITGQISGGSIGANITLRDTTLPTYQANLDEFAENLSTRFAGQGLTLFSNPDGVVPQSTTTPVQSGYVGYSGTITVNPAVVADPSLVRDGTQAVVGSATGPSAFTPNPATGGLAGFTTLINRVLNYALGSDAQTGVAQAPLATSLLGPSGTLGTNFTAPLDLGDYANALTASQSSDSANATTQSTDTQGVQTSLQNMLTGTTGVDMDTELGRMIQLQNAYGANAKVISTVQEMFADALAMIQ
jgi:flagellar hook-associated protein 1 FlgK